MTNHCKTPLHSAIILSYYKTQQQHHHHRHWGNAPLLSSQYSMSPKTTVATTNHVQLPDRNIITYNHTGYLGIPGFPKAATQANIFLQLCDHRCTATFTSNQVTINHQNQIALTGTHYKPGLWCVNTNLPQAHNTQCQ